MYVIKNIGKYEIALGDLHICLRPGQSQDLDMICSRYTSEQSKSLKGAIRAGQVKIIHKDTNGEAVIMDSKAQTLPQVDANEKILQEMQQLKKEMIDRQEAIARRQQAIFEKSSKDGGLDPQATEQLQAAIAALQAITGGQTNTVQPSKNDRDYDIPDDKAVEVHKRTIERLSKNTQGTIKHEESKSKINVDDKINELEDLLG